MRFLRRLAIFALTTWPLLAAAQSAVPSRPEPAGWERTAHLVGVFSDLENLHKLSEGGEQIDRWRALWLHQHIYEKVMAASLQVDSTLAQIDNEISRANELRGYLADRRDRSVNRYNLLSVIVGGGLGATGSSMQLVSGLDKAGNGVNVGAGTVAAGLALAGIHAQKGHTARFDFESNMLAEFFDRPMLPDSHYPVTVWTFLNQNAPAAVAGTSRREQLLQSWVQVRRIDSLSSREKIDRLTSAPSQSLQLSIDDLEDRAAMLHDVGARISFLKRDLGDLLASLPDAPRQDETGIKSGP